MLAQCTVKENRRVAVFHFEKAFGEPRASAVPDMQRRTVVHELTHCHLERPWEFASQSMEVAVGADHGLTFNRAHNGMMEVATDSIAIAIAAFFPLPPALLSVDSASKEDVANG